MKWFFIKVILKNTNQIIFYSMKKEKRNAWVKQTLIIFICAQIAHIILSFILNKPITWKVLITPCYTLWYLVCLIYWRLFLWAVNNKCKDSILLLASFILLILCGFVPINQEFSFQRTFSFFPYFILGFLLKKNGMMNRIEAIPIQVAILFLIMELIVARFLPLYMPRTYFHSLNDALIRVSQTILGVALCLSIIRLSRIRYWEYVAKYGKYTLGLWWPNPIPDCRGGDCLWRQAVVGSHQERGNCGRCCSCRPFCRKQFFSGSWFYRLSNKSFSNLKAIDVSVVVPLLEMTLMAKFLSLRYSRTW